MKCLRYCENVMRGRVENDRQDQTIDEIIRLLAQAAGIAQRKRMSMTLRRQIGNALDWAFAEAERLRARKRK